MSEDKTEVSTNFTPSLRKDLKGKPEGGKLQPQEIQAQTQKLFNLLVQRVELKIDISRQSKGSSNNTVPEPDLNTKLDLIKDGGWRAIPRISGENVKARTLENDLKKLRETEQQISDLTKNSQVIEQYSKFREERIAKLQKAKEVTDLHDVKRQLILQQEKMARMAFLEHRQYSPGERQVIDENKQLIQAMDTRASELIKDPEVFDMARIRQLESYQKGLKKDKFAETPSREKYIDTVRSFWARGHKVLLTGPTGGGKTELLLHASRNLFGKEAERLTGHELMTNYEVYGKTKGGVQDGKVALMFGSAPFIRAIERNVPFVFDEINVVPNKILMRLKTDLNARVGQEVTIQEDSDKKVVVGDKFAVGATENVKSEKHVEREKLDPALVRMFEALAIDYFPPEELYDIMLASMMDVKGGVKLSVKDANDTLKALCDTTEWIQQAYLGQNVQTADGQILEARGQGSLGKSATLQEAVLDPGKSLDMLVGWEDAEISGLTFREFLNKRITAFINNENYPEEDRYYLTEIFALQGFLRGVKVSELRVAGLDQATLDAWSGFDGKRYVPKNNYIPAETVAKLDPYGTQKRPVGVEANDLLDEGETVEEVKEEEIDVKEAAAKAVQTKSKQQQTTPTVPVSPGALPSEIRRALDVFDIQNQPSDVISGTATTINSYMGKVSNFLNKYPGSVAEISKRCATIIYDMSPLRMYAYINGVLEVAKLAGNDIKAKQNIRDIISKVDSLTLWKSGTDTQYIQVILDKLSSIEQLVT